MLKICMLFFTILISTCLFAQNFQAPDKISLEGHRWPWQKFENYPSKVQNSAASFSTYFDSSITILSSSGDTEDITIAKKEDRIYLYNNYKLVGSNEGYTETEVLTALTDLQPENRYWRDVTKYSAISVGTSATLLTMFYSVVAPVANVLSQAAFYGRYTVDTPGEVFLSTALMTSLVAIPIIVVYNKFSGKPTVHRNVMTSFRNLQSQGANHIGLFRSESHFYTELMHKAARSIKFARNPNPDCQGYF